MEREIARVESLSIYLEKGKGQGVVVQATIER